MVVCRYYQQGNCRYGDRCRFEHPNNTGYSNQSNYNSNNAYRWYGGGYRGGNSGSGGGVTFKDTFSTSNRFEALSQQDGKQGRSKVNSGLLSLTSQDILNTISSDMEMWQTTHVWEFSCYSYFKDGSCIPGLDDVSPEELRLEAYEAQKSGSAQLYLQKVKDLVNKFRQLRSELARQSMQTKQKLIQIIEEDRKRVERGGPASSTVVSGLFTSSALNEASAFGQSSAGLFGGQGATQPSSDNLFGKPAQSSGSLFGNNQSGNTVFGSTQPESAFGSSQSGASVFGNNQPGSNLFGSSQPSNSAFGNNQSGSSIFGGNQSGGAFGSSQPGASVFGGNQSGASVFGGSTPTGNSLFGGNQQKPGFGAAEVQGGVFGNATRTAVTGFGGASSGGGAVGGQPAGATPFGASSSPQTVTAAQAPSTGASAPISTMYTQLSELTAEERQQFEAVVFTAGKLPTRPPPKELC